MIEEELPDELENDLDDIEPVGDESQLYEHFRVVVDKGQAMVIFQNTIAHPFPAWNVFGTLNIIRMIRNRSKKDHAGFFI